MKRMMELVNLDDRFSNIKNAYLFSKSKLDELEVLNRKYDGCGVFLVANGSLARKEVVEGSDFDAFIVRSQGCSFDGTALWEEAREIVELNDPGSTGVFGAGSLVEQDSMLVNIGGSEDSNEKITQRMLFFLESIPVGDVSAFYALSDLMIERYVSSKITDHQLALFLMNDVIRYYRTICVDFEFKTVEDGKPWGIRNIKLVFSRKLIYYTGILMCAETAQRTATEKRLILSTYMRMTPIERMLAILGEGAFEALSFYDLFLAKMSDPATREALKSQNREELRQSELFRTFKNDGHHFSISLRNAFIRHYDSTHPIHRAILF